MKRGNPPPLPLAIRGQLNHTRASKKIDAICMDIFMGPYIKSFPLFPQQQQLGQLGRRPVGLWRQAVTGEKVARASLG